MEAKQMIVDTVKKQLSEVFPEEKGYSIATDVKWGPTSSRLTFDLVVRKDSVLFIIFDIIPYHISEPEEVLIPVLHLKSTSAKFYIRYMGEYKTYLLFEKDYIPSSDLINHKQEFCTSFTSIEQVVNLIRNLSKSNSDILTNKDAGSNINPKNIKFYESREKVLDPEWCRGELLGFNDAKICRYSTLDSLFSMLKYQSMRMNGLPGMNDREEGLFAWRLINEENSTENNELKRRKRLINNAFIVSFSKGDKVDNLTHWRLYGDDAKGVCCEYSIQKEKVKDRFFLHPIKYLVKIDDKKYKLDDLLASFKYDREHRSDLDYPDLSPAIFFYKPNDFESEDEVRLLVDNKRTTAFKAPEYKREWVLTKANNIPNSFIDIPLKDIPLKLDRIILGPNINDADTIQAQLETLLEQQGIDAIVELSKIKSYRNPMK